MPSFFIRVLHCAVRECSSHNILCYFTQRTPPIHTFLGANHFVSNIQRELGGSERSDRKQKLGAPKPRSVNTRPSGQHPRVNWRLASAIREVCFSPLFDQKKYIQFDYQANQATSQPQSTKLAQGEGQMKPWDLNSNPHLAASHQFSIFERLHRCPIMHLPTHYIVPSFSFISGS